MCPLRASGRQRGDRTERVVERHDRVDEVQEHAHRLLARVGHDALVLVDREVGVVLQDQSHPWPTRRRGRAAQHLGDVLALALDQLRLGRQIGAVEPRRQPQRRASQRHRAFQPAFDARRRRRPAVSPRRGEPTKSPDASSRMSMRGRARRELGQLRRRTGRERGAGSPRRRARPRTPLRDRPAPIVIAPASSRMCQQSVSTPSAIVTMPPSVPAALRAARPPTSR